MPILCQRSGYRAVLVLIITALAVVVGYPPPVRGDMLPQPTGENEVMHFKGFGIADPTGRGVTPQTPFVLNSISKSFVALANQPPNLSLGGRHATRLSPMLAVYR